MDKQNDLTNFYANEPDPGLTSRDGRIEYEDLVERGQERIVLPLPIWEQKTSGRATEDVHSGDLARHVASRIEQSIKDETFYSGTKPDEVMDWYIGSLKGLNLIDERTAGRLNELSDGLAGAEDKQKYFQGEVRPFLASMRHAKR